MVGNSQNLTFHGLPVHPVTLQWREGERKEGDGENKERWKQKDSKRDGGSKGRRSETGGEKTKRHMRSNSRSATLQVTITKVKGR